MTDKSMGKGGADHHGAKHAPEAAECAERAVQRHAQAMHEAGGEPAARGGAVCQYQPRLPALVRNEPRPMLPSVSSIIQAGAFGAALGGMTTGVMEMARVKQGEISTDEAIRNVVKSSAQGAATMVVASVAAQVVRSHPVFGFAALAAAGIGAFIILSGANTGPAHAAPAGNLPGKPATAPKKPA